MNIISKYKDYYDSAVGMGIDKTIVYVRDNKEFEKTPEDVLETLGIDDQLNYWTRYKKLNIFEISRKKSNFFFLT